MRHLRFALALLAALLSLQPASARAQQPAVVHAVLFWMDGCTHCHDVIDHVLPPLQAKYGTRLEVRLVEVITLEDVDRLYRVAASFSRTKEQTGVPFLVIGDRALAGADQIAAELPGLIEQHLAAGGVAYPELDGLASPLTTSATDPALCAPATPCASPEAAMAEGALSPRGEHPAAAVPPLSDGFGLAIAILVGMAFALVYVGIRLAQARRRSAADRRPGPVWRGVLFPILATAGLGVAGYLAYVETQAVPALCGPVGDCNAVQSSSYARLFGVWPIGVLGVAGYAAILALWSVSRRTRAASGAVFGLTVGGVAFSLYLTYLEPFVIGAVCAWCLTSAVIMTVLMLLSLEPALQARDRDAVD